MCNSNSMHLEINKSLNNNNLLYTNIFWKKKLKEIKNIIFNIT